MKVVLFCHSLISDWNHGNAHFLRGVVTELIERGHDVRVYEPRNAWSVENLLAERGPEAIDAFHGAYPKLRSTRYELSTLDLDEVLDGAALVIVHEWNAHQLVADIGRHRARTRSYRLLFHDTHHRASTAGETMAAYDLRHYDGVLAFGGILRDLYLRRGWAARAWTWHEAADTRVFKPLNSSGRGDLVWIGNWGDEERTAELEEFLFRPTEELRLQAKIFGVRYPEEAKRRLARANIEYGGWLPNFEVPQTFARYRVTVHVPRRPYTRSLPGIPTIRPFEAMACGIPLVSAPWDDAEHLFRTGVDYVMARDGAEMKQALKRILRDRLFAKEIARNGLETIRQHHTCAHRATELLRIYDELQREVAPREIRAASPVDETTASGVEP